jgi:hypothetical protein
VTLSKAEIQEGKRDPRQQEEFTNRSEADGSMWVGEPKVDGRDGSPWNDL